MMKTISKNPTPVDELKIRDKLTISKYNYTMKQLRTLISKKNKGKLNLPEMLFCKASSEIK